MLAMVAATFAFVRPPDILRMVRPFLTSLAALGQRACRPFTIAVQNNTVLPRALHLGRVSLICSVYGNINSEYTGFSNCLWHSMLFGYGMSSNSLGSLVSIPFLPKWLLPQHDPPTHPPPGFHLALIVFAAIQVHETHSALVAQTPTSWVVSIFPNMHGSARALMASIEQRRLGLAMAQGLALSYCDTGHYRGVLVVSPFLGQRALLRIRVCSHRLPVHADVR